MTYINIDHRQNFSILTLTHAEKHNALTPEMISELSESFDRMNQSNAIRALLIKGEGKSFCAGADLNWMKNSITFSEQENINDALKLAAMLEKLYQLPFPTVALAQGATYGGGIGLLACCDIVFANAQAEFCFSEVKLGIAPAVISPFVLKAIGARHAKRFCLSAEKFSAQTAKAINLVHDILDGNDDEQCLQFMQNLSQNGPQSMKMTKSLLNTLDQSVNIADTKTRTAQIIAKLRVSDEGQEGMKAFLEKRPANWCLP